MFGVSPALVSLLAEVNGYLQKAMVDAMRTAALGVRPDADKIADRLYDQMTDWHPAWKGRKLADEATKQAGARFLAGVACNLAAPQAGKAGK